MKQRIQSTDLTVLSVIVILRLFALPWIGLVGIVLIMEEIERDLVEKQVEC